MSKERMTVIVFESLDFSNDVMIFVLSFLNF